MRNWKNGGIALIRPDGVASSVERAEILWRPPRITLPLAKRMAWVLSWHVIVGDVAPNMSMMKFEQLWYRSDTSRRGGIVGRIVRGLCGVPKDYSPVPKGDAVVG